MSLNKTNKEWVVNPDGTKGYVWNPIIRYPNIESNSEKKEEGGSHCMAKNILAVEKLVEPYRQKKASRILTCSKTDLFSPYNRMNWIGEVLACIGNNPRHDFILVTEFAKCLLKWERFIPKENTWLGVRINQKEDAERTFYIRMIEAKIRFILIESLNEVLNLNLFNIDWIVLDGNSRVEPKHLKKCLLPLVEQAKELGIPIFMGKKIRWENRIQEFANQ